MVDYMATFKASFARVTGEELRSQFFDLFYERFIASEKEVAALFAETDMSRQKDMLRESLVELMEFCVTMESNPYIVTLARVHGVRGRNIPLHMFDLWLDSLVATVRRVDPGQNENVEAAWRVVLAPGIAFMKFYRDR